MSRVGVKVPFMGAGGRSGRAAADLISQPDQRVVLRVDDPFLERDDAVVRDLDVFGTHLRTTFRDVAQTKARLLLRQPLAVVGVERVHVEFGKPDEEPRAREALLVLIVVADHVAGVLTEEALDALAELLRPLDIDLRHPVRAVRLPRAWHEGRYLLRLLVVEGDVGDQVLDDRKGTKRGDDHRFVLSEDAHPRHAHQPRYAVDLRRAGPALPRLAVPPEGEVTCLRCLQPVNDVEDHLTIVDPDIEVLERTAVRGPPPDLEVPYPGVASARRSSTWALPAGGTIGIPRRPPGGFGGLAVRASL